MYPAKVRENIFIVFAILFAVAALYHIIAVFFKINESSVERNILFALINLVCIYGVLKRPVWFVYCFPVLLVQQYYTHGSDLINTRNANGKIDWISILVLVTMPVIFFYLIRDIRKK